MNQKRLGVLTDGVFALAAILLAIGLKVPIIISNSSQALWMELEKTWPILFVFIMSLAFLFAYWRAHRYMFSIISKGSTTTFANLNGLFLLAIMIMPYSASILAKHYNEFLAMMLYGLNIVIVGSVLLWMRRYWAKGIGDDDLNSNKSRHHSGNVRIILPVFASILSFIISFWSGASAVIFLTITAVFNLHPASSMIVHRFMDHWFSDDEESVTNS